MKLFATALIFLFQTSLALEVVTSFEIIKHILDHHVKKEIAHYHDDIDPAGHNHASSTKDEEKEDQSYPSATHTHSISVPTAVLPLVEQTSEPIVHSSPVEYFPDSGLQISDGYPLSLLRPPRAERQVS